MSLKNTYNRYRESKRKHKILKVLGNPYFNREGLLKVEVFDCLKERIKTARPKLFQPKEIEHMIVNREHSQRMFKKRSAKKEERYRLHLERQALQQEAKRLRKAKRKKKSHHGRRTKKRLTYNEYINGDLWRERKNRYFRSHPRNCLVCGGCNHIHLHHGKYERYGEEKDEHLFPLCNDHHAMFHLDRKTHKNMIKETHNFIEEQRQIIEHGDVIKSI